jgi:hypothetical protein
MRQVKRPRRYISRHLLLLLRPALRYSSSRRAYVLRLVGNKTGPVLRLDRRTAHQRPAGGVDRRGRASTI